MNIVGCLRGAPVDWSDDWPPPPGVAPHCLVVTEVDENGEKFDAPVCDGCG